MRIMIVGPGKRFLGGVSYYTISLANALARHHEVSALLLRQLVPTRLFPGARRVGQPISALSLSEDIAVMDGLDWYWGRTAARAAKFLREQRPDVIILQWWSSAATHSYLLLRLMNLLATRARVIVEFHEILDPLEQKLAPLRLYVRATKGMLFRNIDAYTTHSHKDMDEITRTYKLDRDKGFVITHGSYDHFRRQQSTQHEPTDPFTILYLGLIRPYKGVEYLVQAFDTLPTEVAHHVRLIIVGETWEGHNLPEQLIARSRYRSRIEFVNRYVTDEEVDGFFSKADVACFPYLRASQSGAAHIAMNYGIPIIASKVGGLGESLSEYDGTLFCEPGSVQQLRDTLIKSIGTRERGFRDPFSWERSAQEYQDVFQSLPLASQPTSPYTWKPRVGRS